MKSGIYKILNTKTNKFYIGSAINLKERRRLHFLVLANNNHCNIHLQRSYNKHSGWFFDFIILEYCENKDLIKCEQYYIDTLKPEYNIYKIAGSPLGTKHDKGFKIKARNRQIGIRYIENHRDYDKWPCDNGIKCRCDECKKKKNNYMIQYRLKNKIKDQYIIEVI